MTTVLNVDVSDHIILHNVEELSSEAIEDLRNIGRWGNPEYYKKKAMHFWVGNLPKYVLARHMFLEDDHRSLSYERGLWPDLLNVFKKHPDIKLKINMEIKESKVDYPEFNLTLEEYQNNDLHTIVSAKSQGIISYPTGGGKTIIAAALLGKLKQRTLICVHTKDLADQWERVLKSKCYSGLSVSRVGSGKCDWSGRHVVIGLVQSLKKYVNTEEFQQFGCVILDECHHVSAPSFTEVIGKSKAKHRYGLSATLKRQDNKDFLLGALFGGVITELGYKDIESRVDLPEVMQCEYHTALQPPQSIYSIRGGREYLNMIELHKYLFSDTDRNNFISTIINECMSDNSNTVLVLVKLRSQAEYIYEAFKDSYPTGLLMGGGSSAYLKEKEAIISDANSGRIRLLIGTSVADEGLDIARLNRLILVSPASFEGLLKQRMGRIIRKHPDKKGKPVIYDIVDAEIPEMLRSWSRREKLYKDLEITVRRHQNG